MNTSIPPESKPLSIALFTPAPWESAVVVLRVTGPAEMAGMRVIQGNQGPLGSFDEIAETDLVVIQRDFPRFWEQYRKVIKTARDLRKPVIYELDDLLIEIPENHSHRADYAGEMLTMLYAILDADVVTSSSRQLQLYLAELNPNSKLIPNYLNDRLWEVQDQKPAGNKESGITIGYMGGQTHTADLESIENSLLKIHNQHPGHVNFKFWGARPPAELLHIPSTTWNQIDLENYAQFAEYFLQQECDIFIAPLQQGKFNEAKSSIKYLEYGALGIPGVYSNLPPYTSIVEQGVNGFLAGDAGDWESTISLLIADPSLRRQIGSAAKKTIRDGWLLSANISNFAEVYKQSVNVSESTQKSGRQVEKIKSILSMAETYQSGIEEQLFATSNELEEIRDSRSWKLLQQIQKLRLKIIPRD